MKDTETAISEFSGLGINGILPALVYAIFNTSLPEEILFRGFLLKRIQHRFGFIPANIIQSVIFGLMHGVMFFLKVDVVKTLLIILFTSSVAYFMGDINENKFSGSILLSWIIHALSNMVPAFIALFTIL